MFDQNISHRILKLIPKEYAHSTTVKALGLMNSTDKAIWDFAKANDYIIVTQDSDFNDLNSLYGFPPKIIWMRTGNHKTQAIVDFIVEYTGEIQRFLLDTNYGCFEILQFKSKI